jgi:hypothetical protein
MSNLHPEKRRSPRFPFDSLVRLTAFRLGKETPLWGRSTDLCREGIGVSVSDVALEEVVAIQISLPEAKIVTVKASVRYCNQGRCGFEFVDLRNRQREAIQAACEKLRKATPAPPPRGKFELGTETPGPKKVV